MRVIDSGECEFKDLMSMVTLIERGVITVSTKHTAGLTVSEAEGWYETVLEWPNQVSRPQGDGMFKRWDVLPGGRNILIVQEYDTAQDARAGHEKWLDENRVGEAIIKLRHLWKESVRKERS